MTAADDDTAEQHINPATGWVETIAHDDDPGAPAARAAAAGNEDGDEGEDEEHINPATGYVETIAHDDRRRG